MVKSFDIHMTETGYKLFIEGRNLKVYNFQQHLTSISIFVGNSFGYMIVPRQLTHKTNSIS